MKLIFKSFVLLTLGLIPGSQLFAQATVADTAKIAAKDTSKTINMMAATPVVHKPVVHKPKGPKPITKEMAGGIHLNTNGWSIFVDRGKVKTDDEKHSDMFYNIRLLQVEFEEVKNPKEYKSTNSDVSTYTGQKSGTYIYGKENNFYALKLGWGFRKMIAGKPDPKTVSIHWVNVGGLALGMMKPYYLKADVNGAEQEIKYSDTTANFFLNQNDILGKSSFTKGISEIKFVPGVHFKTGLHFDFANNRKLVIAAEAGLSGEYYTQKIALMANQKAYPYVLNAYLALEFGKRW
jgi:hypothetical protein